MSDPIDELLNRSGRRQLERAREEQQDVSPGHNPFDTPQLRVVLAMDIETKLVDHFQTYEPPDAGADDREVFRTGMRAVAVFMAAYICDGGALRAVSL